EAHSCQKARKPRGILGSQVGRVGKPELRHGSWSAVMIPDLPGGKNPSVGRSIDAGCKAREFYESIAIQRNVLQEVDLDGQHPRLGHMAVGAANGRYRDAKVSGPPI